MKRLSAMNFEQNHSGNEITDRAASCILPVDSCPPRDSLEACREFRLVAWKPAAQPLVRPPCSHPPPSAIQNTTQNNTKRTHVLFKEHSAAGMRLILELLHRCFTRRTRVKVKVK